MSDIKEKVAMPALPYYPWNSSEYKHIKYRIRVNRLGMHHLVLKSKMWKLMNWDKVKESWTKYNSKPESIERRKTYYQRNKIRINKRKREHYEENLLPIQNRKRIYYLKNRTAIRIKNRRYYLAWKNYNKYLVVFHYTNGKMCCSNCHETIPELLTVDHIAGGGHKHRKSIGFVNFNVWLRRNNFPEGYQILCYNCNMIKHKVTLERYNEIIGELQSRKLYMDLVNGGGK